MAFGSDIARYAQKTGLSIDNAVVSICAQLSKSIIDDTPVDKGTLRGNWYATIGSPSNSKDENRLESEAISDAQSKSKDASGAVFYLTNNLEYAHRIEYQGWSKYKAPAGMVRKNVEIIKTKLSLFGRG